MRFIGLLMAASMPVVKLFLIIGLGLFLALDNVDILGDNACNLFNKVVFFVFNPALVGSSLAKTITFQTLITLWFMPVNILITFIIGSAFGWILVKITSAPNHLKGLIIGSCSAGNLGIMIVVIIPAICKEKARPFGAADVCQTYGLSYSLLSLALGSIHIWLYVYNIVRIYSKEIVESEAAGDALPTPHDLINRDTTIVPLSCRMKQCFKKCSRKINLKALLSPSIIGAIVGFVIGTIPPFKKLFIGNDAPLHVIEDAASLLGDAAIPTVVLILGANLLRGLKRSSVHFGIIIGILLVRYIFLPLLGILIVKGAIRLGLVHSDPLFQFILLLQYALPPAMSLGTITQIFGVGQSECSIIMLWSYGLASIALTLWCTLFLWLVAS